jgi:hypothetical protein
VVTPWRVTPRRMAACAAAQARRSRTERRKRGSWLFFVTSPSGARARCELAGARSRTAMKTSVVGAPRASNMNPAITSTMAVPKSCGARGRSGTVRRKSAAAACTHPRALRHPRAQVRHGGVAQRRGREASKQRCAALRCALTCAHAAARAQARRRSRRARRATRARRIMPARSRAEQPQGGTGARTLAVPRPSSCRCVYPSRERSEPDTSPNTYCSPALASRKALADAACQRVSPCDSTKKSIPRHVRRSLTLAQRPSSLRAAAARKLPRRWWAWRGVAGRSPPSARSAAPLPRFLYRTARTSSRGDASPYLANPQRQRDHVWRAHVWRAFFSPCLALARPARATATFAGGDAGQGCVATPQRRCGARHAGAGRAPCRPAARTQVATAGACAHLRAHFPRHGVPSKFCLQGQRTAQQARTTRAQR